MDRKVRSCLAAVAFAIASLPTLCAAQAADPVVFVREFVNTITGHYFMTASDTEAAGIEAGAAGPGWQSTGYEFVAAPYDAAPVCRFYAPAPTNSHFYTADPAECDFLKTHDTGWQYEGIAFQIEVPTNGVCGAGRTPVTRMYNNRAAALDSNHRFTIDERVVAEMRARAWVVEGVAFCTLSSTFTLRAFNNFLAPFAAPSPYCPASTVLGPNPETCIALYGLLEMPEKLGNTSPGYTREFAAKTGWGPGVDTVFARSFDAGAPERSFVQAFYGGLLVGVHLVSKERTFGMYAAISPTMYNLKDFSGVGPVFPWDNGGEYDVLVNFQLKIATLIRSDDSAQAYGGPILEFADRRSGVRFLVRALAYGSQAPADFVGNDPISGKLMVSTTFAAPRFGRALKGQYITCGFATLATGGCPASGIDYSYRLDRDDFANVLALARTVNSTLSTDIAGYQLIGLQMRNESFGDVELGLLENQIQVSVTK